MLAGAPSAVCRALSCGAVQNLAKYLNGQIESDPAIQQSIPELDAAPVSTCDQPATRCKFQSADRQLSSCAGRREGWC